MYVVGLISAEQRAELERRGWEIEPAPESLVKGSGAEDPKRWGMVFVDADAFDVMNGPDWDGGTGKLPSPPKLARGAEWIASLAERPESWIGTCVRVNESKGATPCRETEERPDAMCLHCEARHYLDRLHIAARRLNDLDQANGRKS